MGLSSFIKEQGHDCFYLDTKFERNLIKEVKRISPQIIAYSISTGMHKFYLQINSILKKELHFVSVFGGAHCTFFPEFINKDGVDVICRGEGEYALLELINNISSNTDYRYIRNLWIKKDGVI